MLEEDITVVKSAINEPFHQPVATCVMQEYWPGSTIVIENK
jgi:hypothetical protein